MMIEGIKFIVSESDENEGGYIYRSLIYFPFIGKMTVIR
jgi:hypothetical protein